MFCFGVFVAEAQTASQHESGIALVRCQRLSLTKEAFRLFFLSQVEGNAAPFEQGRDIVRHLLEQSIQETNRLIQFAQAAPAAGQVQADGPIVWLPLMESLKMS